MDEEEEEIEIPSYPWTKEHATYDVMAFAAILQRVTADYLEQVSMRMAADSNQAVDNATFHQEAAQAIEQIIEGE